MGVDWGKSKVMGGYFTALIDNGDKEWHWSLIPFMLIWAIFVALLAVRFSAPCPCAATNSLSYGSSRYS